MSEDRDRMALSLVQAGGHPLRSHAVLLALRDVMREKISEHIHSNPDFDTEFVKGMKEMYALVVNLRTDIAQDYGIEEGKDGKH